MPLVEDLRDVEVADLREPSVIAMSAVFAAATTIGTMVVTIPVGPGVFNVGEIVIYTAAFLFGGVVGGLAGGVGAAAADVILGFGMWAPITFVVKGLEGFVVGQLAGPSAKSKAIAVALGAPFMIVGYFIAAYFLVGGPYAIFNELPMDILQASIGFAVAYPLSAVLEDRLPRLR